MTYEIYLTARNEGVKYVDESGVYRFNVSLEKGVWTVYLPGTFGDCHETKVLSEAEQNRIIPRVVEYLKEIKWLGLFKNFYDVRIVDNSV